MLDINIIADGEPVLRANVHRARPGVAAARGTGTTPLGGSRRVPQYCSCTLHPPHSSPADRAARLALAAARLRGPLLLPFLQITIS